MRSFAPSEICSSDGNVILPGEFVSYRLLHHVKCYQKLPGRDTIFQKINVESDLYLR